MKKFIVGMVLLFICFPLFSMDSVIYTDEFWSKDPSFEEVEFELNKGVELNVINEHSITPLMNACGYISDPKIINLFVEKGAEIDFVDPAGQSALLYAAALNDHLDVIKALIDNGANVNLQEYPLCHTALSVAIFEDANIEVMDYLIDMGANLYLQDIRSEDSFDYMGQYLNLEELIHFIDKLNIQKNDLNKMLITSVLNEDERVFDYLLDLGSDIRFKNDNGQSALTMVVGYNNNVQLLNKVINSNNLTHEELLDMLFDCIRYNNSLDILKTICDKGISLNEKDSDGFDAVYYTFAYSSSKEIFEYVINHASDLDGLYEEDGQSLNALDLFFTWNYSTRLIPYLIDKFEITDEQLFDYFLKSLNNPLEFISEWFLEEYYDIENPSKELIDIMFFAAARVKYPERLAYLIDYFNIDEDDLNFMFTYSLMFNPSLDVIQFYIDEGMEVNDDSNNSYLALAAINKNPEIVDYLLEIGCDAKKVDEDIQLNAMQVARQNKYIYLTPTYWRLVYKTLN